MIISALLGRHMFEILGLSRDKLLKMLVFFVQAGWMRISLVVWNCIRAMNWMDGVFDSILITVLVCTMFCSLCVFFRKKHYPFFVHFLEIYCFRVFFLVWVMKQIMWWCNVATSEAERKELMWLLCKIFLYNHFLSFVIPQSALRTMKSVLCKNHVAVVCVLHPDPWSFLVEYIINGKRFN